MPVLNSNAEIDSLNLFIYRSHYPVFMLFIGTSRRGGHDTPSFPPRPFQTPRQNAKSRKKIALFSPASTTKKKRFVFTCLYFLIVHFLAYLCLNFFYSCCGSGFTNFYMWILVDLEVYLKTNKRGEFW